MGCLQLQGGSPKLLTAQTGKKGVDSAENLVELLEGQEIGFSDQIVRVLVFNEAVESGRNVCFWAQLPSIPDAFR